MLIENIILIPKNNEEELIAEAKKQGYKKMIFLYENHEALESSREKHDKDTKENNIEIRYGAFLDNIKKIKKKTRKQTNKDNIIKFAKLDDNIRNLIERESELYIIMNHDKKRDDFLHHRNSGLNQVLCNIMKRKKHRLVFLLDELLTEKNPSAKKTIIGRVKQNMVLARKSKIDVMISVKARCKEDVRSLNDMKSMFSILAN